MSGGERAPWSTTSGAFYTALHCIRKYAREGRRRYTPRRRRSASMRRAWLGGLSRPLSSTTTAVAAERPRCWCFSEEFVHKVFRLDTILIVKLQFVALCKVHIF